MIQEISNGRQTLMSVIFRFYRSKDWPDLLAMYLSFEPKGIYKGLPPIKESMTRRWLSGLIEDPNNTHFILRTEIEVMGHAALVYYPCEPRKEEIIIFVHQDYQHQGWGRKLFLAAMHWACRRLKLRQVWLTVEWDNPRAWRLYRSIGFRPLSPERMFEPEFEMVRPLQCEKCLKEECPIYAAELMRFYLWNYRRGIDGDWALSQVYASAG